MAQVDDRRTVGSVPFRLEAFGLSVVGKVRPRNEDALAVIPSMGLVVVADGLGGGPGGDVASAMAVQGVVRALRAGRGLREALVEANGQVLRVAEERRELRGMGTTVTALQVDQATWRFGLAHVGDSRAYRLRKGEFLRLTRAHTLVQEWVTRGLLAPEEACEHPLSHVLSRALGVGERVEADFLEGEVEVEDRFLLCSDGLVQVVDEVEMQEWLQQARGPRLRKAVEGMVEQGLRRGAPDNITVAVLSLERRHRPSA